MPPKVNRGQMDLFALPEKTAANPGSMDYRQEVSLLLAGIIKDFPADRYEIAARMGRLTGRDVSKYMVDAWCSESRDGYNLPFYLVPVLEEALATTSLTTWLAEKRGGQALFGRAVLEAELGRLEALRDQAGSRIRLIKKAMGEP